MAMSGGLTLHISAAFRNYFAGPGAPAKKGRSTGERPKSREETPEAGCAIADIVCEDARSRCAYSH